MSVVTQPSFMRGTNAAAVELGQSRTFTVPSRRRNSFARAWSSRLRAIASSTESDPTL